MSSLFKKISFWSILSSFLLSLFILFVTPYIFDSFKDLNFRLLIAFCIFFGVIIIILLIILLRKEETQEKIQERKERFELEREYKKIITQKVNDLNSKLKNAIKIIKKSSIYKYKRKVKYELPWYMVIGNNNEGKTTLLETSGLEFPLNIDYKDRELIEETNTKNFEWYFAEHAIFIDVPGNYIELKQNPEDPIVWKEFLRIFVKKRWKRPVNGIILTVSAETILNKNQREFEQYSKDLRDRFDELSLSFMSSIPIYLIITKSDLIEGFDEYFSSIDQDEKDEILGLTFDEKIKNVDSSVIKPQLENLLKRLNSSILDKIHYEWDISNKGKIFSFCDNFSNFFEKTNLFVEMCFSQTRYRKPLLLRGVYFTSVSNNEDIYSNRLIASKDFENSRINSKGMFIKKLLNDIIFPEADMIKIDDNYKRKIRVNHYITYILSALIISLFSFFIIKDFINQNNLFSKIENEYNIYQEKSDKILQNGSFKEMAEVLNHLNEIKKYNELNSSDSISKLLFYKVENRKKKLNQIYHAQLIKLLLPEIAKNIEYNIKNEIKIFDKTWDSTKAYIMLEQIKRRDISFLKSYMSFYWNKNYSNQLNVQKDLNYHWDNLLKLDFNSYNINSQTLKFARNALLEVSPEELVYKELKNKVSKMDISDFSFSKVLGSNINSFNGGDFLISGFYTKEGYKVLEKEGISLISQVLDNNWVIGEKNDSNNLEVTSYYNKILSLYFNDYKNYWNTALSRLTIPSYENLIELLEQASLFSSSDSPAFKILKALKDNTQIYSPSEELQRISSDNLTNTAMDKTTQTEVATSIVKTALNKSDKLFDNSSIKSMRDFFEPYTSLVEKESPSSSLESATKKVSYAYQILTSIQGAITPDADAFRLVTGRIKGSSEAIVIPLNLLPVHVKKWYGVILQNDWKFLLKKSKNFVNLKYKEEVYDYYSSRIKDKYPFNKNESNNFVRLDDFRDFFKEDGILENFYNKYLSNYLVFNKNTYTYENKNLDGNMVNFDKSIIEGMIKNQKIKRAFFRNDGTLGFDIIIRPHDLSSNLATMQFEYDNESIYYEHGPIIDKKLSWPLENSKNLIKFKLFDISSNLVTDIYLDNDWSLFKLLNNFNNSSFNENTILSKYIKDNYYGSYQLKGSISEMFGEKSSLSSFQLRQEL